MLQCVYTFVMLLMILAVGSLPVHGGGAAGVKLDGNVLVRWPVEYQGRVVIPDEVHHIADYAFRDCKNVTDVVFPNGVRTIGEGAFARCFGLDRITVPVSVTNIGESAFFLCWNLTNLTIKAELRSIPRAMCLRCVRLECVDLPGSLQSIGGESFLSCRSLKSVNIPDGVTEISEKAFGGCSRLKKVVLPKGLKRIGDKAFAGCCDLCAADISAKLAELGCEDVKNQEVSGGAVADASICGLDTVMRAATDELLTEGYPCHVDIFALDRFVAHLNEIKVGMTASEVDGFVCRNGIPWSHGNQVDADGVKTRTSTDLRFGSSRFGSNVVRLEYRDGKVNGIILSEALKLAARAGILKSLGRMSDEVIRWLEICKDYPTRFAVGPAASNHAAAIDILT